MFREELREPSITLYQSSTQFAINLFIYHLCVQFFFGSAVYPLRENLLQNEPTLSSHVAPATEASDNAEHASLLWVIVLALPASCKVWNPWYGTLL